MVTPVKIQEHSSRELLIEWSSGDRMKIPYFQLRFFCPCASCVDEMSGKRVLKKSSVPTDVRPKKVVPVGNYAIQFHWTDDHQTGIYHFERLYDLCRKLGLPPEEMHQERPNDAQID